MKVYVIYDYYGWGKGKTLEEAKKNYRKHNGSLTEGQQYGLAVYETKDIDGIYIEDGMSIRRGKEDKLLSHNQLTH